MNPEPMKPEDRSALEQELLELVFDCHPQPDALRARIAAEPAVQRLLAEVEAKAEVLRAAAHAPAPALQESARHATARRTRTDGVVAGGGGGGRIWLWLAHPLRRVATVAAAAAVIWGGFELWAELQSARVRALDRADIRITLTAPRRVPAGAPAGFTVAAANLLGESVALPVNWRALDDAGVEIAAGRVDVKGQATVTLPPSLSAPARIEVNGIEVSGDGATAPRAALSMEQGTILPLVHLTSDRPVYRPGEAAFLRAVTLDRVTLAPRATGHRGLRLDVRDPRGSVAVTLDGLVPEGAGADAAGVVAARWDIPAGTPGGVYTIEASAYRSDIRSRPLTLLVRDVAPPRLTKRVFLDRKTYAPGDPGVAEVLVERLGTSAGPGSGGSPAAGARVEASLVVDGRQEWSETAPADGDGRARFHFRVPDRVERGDARLVARVSDGAVVETEVKPFVVPTGEVLAELCPEGGELVAGWPCRVYVEFIDPLGRPLSARGRVVDEAGAAVAEVVTEHQGRARFELLPEAGRRYALELAEPVRKTFALPEVKAEGVALRLRGDAVAAGAAIPLRVATRVAEPLVVGAFCRGVLVGQARVEGGGARDVDVTVPASVSGVVRVTVFDRSGHPLAERLVQRLSAQHIAVEIAPQRASLTPGGRQEVTLQARDESGRPVAGAWLGVSVTDRAFEDLGVAPRVALADHVALFEDVPVGEDLEEFFTGHDRSPLATDLLLGTRGWRRFVWRGDEQVRSALTARQLDAAQELAREGFAEAPQTVRSAPGREAERTALARTARFTARNANSVLAFAVMLFALYLLGEGGAALQRVLAGRSTRRIMDWSLVAVGVSVIGLALAANLLPRVVGAGRPPAAWLSDRVQFGNTISTEIRAPGGEPLAFPEAEGVVPDFDFDVEVAQAASIASLTTDITLSPAMIRLFRGAADTTPTVPVREYAHRREASADRADFAATLYWSPLLRTDANGSSRIVFDTSDRVTTWLIAADAHAGGAGGGRIGGGRATFVTTKPFHLEAKLPAEVSQGDELRLPVAVQGDGLAEARIAATVTGKTPREIPPIDVPLADGRGRAFVPLTVGEGVGELALTLGGRADRFTDRITQTLRVVPRGFPHARSFGGVMDPAATLSVPMPRESVAGSTRVTLKVFPSPLSLLGEGLAGIVREPHGCFEQASSSNYPNVLVLSYLEASGDNIPSVAAAARAQLPRGYQLVTGYECQRRGYEWFGSDPGHGALTAYGLMEFQDMARVFDVDRGMVDRTRQWLLGKRDGQGGFGPDGAGHSFGAAPADVINAYLTYGLLYAGEKAETIAGEIDRVAMRVTVSNDPYEVAVATCALAEAGRAQAAAGRARLRSLQQADGSLRGTTTSITSSGGRDLTVETTSFALHAWLSDKAYVGDVEKAVRFLRGCQSAGGTFGATQATILALRALTAYAQENRRMPAAGTVRVLLGGRVVAEREFDAGQRDAMNLDLTAALAPGDNELRFELVAGGGQMPFALDATYHAEQPADDPDGKVTIDTRLAARVVAEGRTVAVQATVTNRTDEGLPMTLAIIGLPAGLEAPTTVLEDLKKSGAVDFWELMGRDVVLYWRGLAPRETKAITLDCVARIPGRSSGAASRAYLYYTPAATRWARPLEVTIRE